MSKRCDCEPKDEYCGKVGCSGGSPMPTIDNKERICEKNCPDYSGMEILHKEQCDCSCHSPTPEKKCDFESDGEVHSCVSSCNGKVENCRKCKKDKCSNPNCPLGKGVSSPTPSWEVRKCKKCNEEKPISEFERCEDWTRNTCRQCRLVKDAKYFQKHKEKKLLQYKARGENPVEAFKRKARMIYRNALTRGEIVRKPCEVCGDEKTHGHHTDYSKPLQVNWLCRKHHYEKHRKQLGK